MATIRTRNALGWGAFGLAVGVIFFSVFYVLVVRTGTAQRGQWTWVGIFLLVLLGPAILGALYGYSRREQPVG